MPGPPNKRQKRDDYRKAQENLKVKRNAANAAPANGGGDGDGSGNVALPQKKFYRQRAHANPFSDHMLDYPRTPAEMGWSTHYPAFIGSDTTASGVPKVEVADIGCGFGGLLMALSPLMPQTLILGMELRIQVTQYVVNKIAALRSQNREKGDLLTTTPGAPPPPTPYQNISAVRANTMKFLPNYFHRGQLSKIFLCFPDPHFKQRKHKARIASAQLNAEYAYVTRPGGMVYTITDVEELSQWMTKHFVGEEAGDARELWERVSQDELDVDPCVKIMSEETEESKKVTRNGGNKHIAVFRRKPNPDWPE